MANRPTGPEQGDDVPEPTQPIDPAATAAQPPVEPAVPASPPASPPAPAPAGEPAWTAAAPHPDASGAPGPSAPPGWAPPPRRPGTVRRTWDDATSSTGGRVAVGAVAVLATLLVVAVIGLGAALVGGHGRGDVARGQAWFGRDDGRMPGRGDGRPGMDGRRDPNGGPMMPGQRQRGGTDGQGRQQGQQGDGDDSGLPQGRQRGITGGMMDGMNGLDDVLHGEFTTTATGSPVVMVLQVGEVTAYTASKTVTVKSADGFEGTYDLTGPYASTRIGLPLEVGAQVRVVAAKDGMKATRLNVLG